MFTKPVTLRFHKFLEFLAESIYNEFINFSEE